MIDHPTTELSFRPAEYFQTTGSDRLDSFANAWCESEGFTLPNCLVSALSCPPSHSGLGSGTQLAHAMALGLNEFCGLPAPPTEKVARVLERGKRSMIGSYGFAKGGLIVDAPPEDAPGQLAHRVEISADWRIALFLTLPSNDQVIKKFGVQEQAAFDNIVAEQANRSRRLEDLITNQMIPASESEDFGQFCNSIYEYGKLSGEYYIDVQGGIYNGPLITSLVETLLQLKATGVGQSSWGPVVFSWCENQQAAEDLLVRASHVLDDSIKTWIARPMNHPASVQIQSIESP